MSSYHSNNSTSQNFSTENQLHNNPFKRSQKWIIWGIGGLFYLYEMILRVSPSVMTNNLMQDFQVSSTSLGVLVSFYYYAYVALQIPCGLIVDKFGARRIITLSALVCTVGTWLFAESHTLLMAQTGRFLIGAGSACAFISCLKITIDWFKPAQFALLAGLTNMMGTLGGIFAGKPLAIAVNNFGWRQATFYMAGIGIIVTILSWMLIRDYPYKTSKSHSTPTYFLNNLKIIMRNPQIWIAGTVGGLMYLPISAFTELWAVPFLMNSYNIDNELASTANITLFIGMALGGPLAAWFSEKFQSYIFVMKSSALIAGIIFIFITCTHFINLLGMFFLLFAAGVAIGGQVLCFTYAKNHSSAEIGGTTMAFTNALVMMSGIIFQPILGVIIDLFWEGHVNSCGIRLYTATCYQLAVLTVPICLLLSWVLLNWSKEKFENKI